MVLTLGVCLWYGLTTNRDFCLTQTLKIGLVQPRSTVFTARYGLSPYIKQTRSVFKGLKAAEGIILTNYKALPLVVSGEGHII